MHLTFLGTGACTSVPLAFCSCASCEAARRIGGKNLRRRTSLLVNDDLLIDLGPDTVFAAAQYGKDLRRVRTILTTHAHSDHYDPSHLNTRLREYGCQAPAPLEIIASPASLKKMADYIEREEAGTRLDTAEGLANLRMTARTCAAGETFVCGRYTVTAIQSRHDPSVDSRLYVVDDGRAVLLYATDSPALDDAQWEALAALGKSFTCAVFDHTYGPLLPDTGPRRARPDHMTAHDVARAAELLHVHGLLAPDGQVWATHFSHEGTPVHEELDAFARQNGYAAAWDGLELDL